MQRTKAARRLLLSSVLLGCAGPAPRAAEQTIAPGVTEPGATEPGATGRAALVPEVGADATPNIDTSDPVPTGGQSGTDEPGDSVLQCPDDEPLDRSGLWQGRPVAELISSVIGTQSFSGEWILSDADADLELSI